MIRYFQLEVEELQATANGEILKSEQVEMLMMRFSGASYQDKLRNGSRLRLIVESVQRAFQNPIRPTVRRRSASLG